MADHRGCWIVNKTTGKTTENALAEEELVVSFADTGEEERHD
jgi:hypothetical protein